MISYEVFLQQVQPEHLNLLATFTAGTRVRAPVNDPEVALLRQRCVDLFQAGALTRVAEGYERDNEANPVWHTFDGYVSEVAKGYVNRLATDRIALSRLPLPVPPAP